MRSRIVATGRATPPTAVSNCDLSRVMDTSDDWIRTRTGIGQRYLMRAGESLVDVAAQASQAALARAGIKADHLDAIVVGTVSSEFAFPSLACLLQERIGADQIPALDVAAACSGFVYGLSVADAWVRAGDFRRVLLVGTDALSTLVNWNDRSTAVLFGDGAGAAVLVAEAGDRGVLASLLRSSGKYWGLLSARMTGTRATLDSEARRAADDAIKMKGPELFRLAVKSMEEVSRDVARQAGIGLGELDLIVPHQANLRIINAVAERLGLAAEKVFTNIERYGNTSAASVPIALDEALEQDRIHANDLIMLSACGGGLTWGSNLLRW